MTPHNPSFIERMFTNENPQDLCNHYLAEGLIPQCAMEEIIQYILQNPTMIPDLNLVKNIMDLFVAAGASPKRVTHILFDIKNDSEESYKIRAMLIDHFGENLNTSFIRYLADWKSLDSSHPYWILLCKSYFLQETFLTPTSVVHNKSKEWNMCAITITIVMAIILIVRTLCFL